MNNKNILFIFTFISLGLVETVFSGTKVPLICLLTNMKSGDIQEILRRDGIDINKINSGPRLKGNHGARLYTADSGEKFVLKEGSLARKEEASWIVSNRLGNKLVPYTERFEVQGRVFSAQRFIEGPKLRIIDLDGTEKVADNLGDIAKNDVSDELLLFDLLLTTSDRVVGGGNYLISSKKFDFASVYDLRKGRPFIDDAEFVAIDNGLTFNNYLIKDFLPIYQGRKTTLPDIKVILKNNPDFVRNLSEWTEKQIYKDLKKLLLDEEITKFLERRKELLNMAGH